MSERSTRDVIALMAMLMLGTAILIVLATVCIIEIVDSERDTSSAAKFLSSLLSALAFGVSGYLLGLHRGDGMTA